MPRKKLILMENEILTEVQTETQPEVKATKCLNCGSEFEGKYCPECGQSADTGRFTPQFILENLRSAIIGNDGGIWYTFKSLFIRPGAMIVEILNGKRKKYFSPFPMLFFMLTVYILLFTLTGSKSDMQTTEKNHLETEGEIDPSLEEHARVVVLGINEFNRLVELGYKFYNNHYTAVFMLTLPFFLFATRVFYGKDNRKRYFRTEYLVAIVYSMVMEVVYRCIVCYHLNSCVLEVLIVLGICISFKLCAKMCSELIHVLNILKAKTLNPLIRRLSICNLDAVNCYCKDNILASKICSAVILRESKVKINCLTLLNSDKAILKSINK